MNDIGVGDLVVCADDKLMPPRAQGHPWIHEGMIYTIRGINPPPEYIELGFLLEETIRPGLRHSDGTEVGFKARRFRKCRPTSIEIFRQIAANPKEKVRA